MPDDIKKSFDSARRKILSLYVGLVKEGIEAGEFREVNPRLAALATLGVANWVSWWYVPDGRYDADEVAETLVSIALNGVLRVTPERSLNRTKADIFKSIERDLAELKGEFVKRS